MKRIRIVVESLVTVRPATQAAFTRFADEYNAVEKPWLLQSGIDLVGVWKLTGGVANQLLAIYGFESLTAMEEAGRAQRAGRPDGTSGATPNPAPMYGWIDDPGFRYQRLVRTVAPFTSLDRLDALRHDPPGAPRQYVELKHRILWGRHAQAHDLIKQQVEEWEAAGLFQLVLAFDNLFGEHGEFTTIGFLPDGIGSLDYLSEKPESPVAERLSQVTTDQRTFFLNPLPFSPLQ